MGRNFRESSKSDAKAFDCRPDCTFSDLRSAFYDVRFDKTGTSDLHGNSVCDCRRSFCSGDSRNAVFDFRRSRFYRAVRRGGSKRRGDGFLHQSTPARRQNRFGSCQRRRACKTSPCFDDGTRRKFGIYTDGDCHQRGRGSSASFGDGCYRRSDNFDAAYFADSADAVCVDRTQSEGRL